MGIDLDKRIFGVSVYSWLLFLIVVAALAVQVKYPNPDTEEFKALDTIVEPIKSEAPLGNN
jgi:hypothetical protein